MAIARDTASERDDYKRRDIFKTEMGDLGIF